jgi:hypothetical protein
VITVGYFHSKDLLPRGDYMSNQAEMFYMNATALHSEYNNARFYITLAHEFQHLINYTQKNLKGKVSSTWYNEMLSAMSEEIMAPYIQSEKYYPRLKDYARPGMANSLAYWDLNQYSVLFHYGEKSAFGGYLLRNYGGVRLAQAIMQNDMIDMESIEAAINTVNGTTDFSIIFSGFVESLFFNNTDAAAMGKTLRTYENPSTETINGTSYTIPEFDIDDFIVDLMENYGTGPFFRFDEYSLLTTIEDAWKCVNGDFSMTVTPPSPGGKIFLIVK